MRRGGLVWLRLEGIEVGSENESASEKGRWGARLPCFRIWMWPGSASRCGDYLDRISSPIYILRGYNIFIISKSFINEWWYSIQKSWTNHPCLYIRFGQLGQWCKINLPQESRRGCGTGCNPFSHQTKSCDQCKTLPVTARLRRRK